VTFRTGIVSNQTNIKQLTNDVSLNTLAMPSNLAATAF